jgi:hypothetical protein
MARGPATRLGLAPKSGGAPEIEGVLKTALSAGGTATGTVYKVTAGAFTVTSRDEPWKDRAGFAGPVGRYFKAVRINGEWRVDVIGCPGSPFSS